MFRLKKVRYKDILSIDRMEIPSGVITCVVGESGAGKTSFLRLLNRMNEPDEGTIYYLGKPLETVHVIEHRRKVTMLSQTPLIVPGTVEENLQLGLQLTDRENGAAKELLNALETVLLDKKLSDNAETLSGGEKQRLGLARLLLMKPEVHLLDEPTAALDEETEIRVMERYFEAVKQEGGSAIIITHSKRLAEQCGEHIIHLKKWRGEEG